MMKIRPFTLEAIKRSTFYNTKTTFRLRDV